MNFLSLSKRQDREVINFASQSFEPTKESLFFVVKGGKSEMGPAVLFICPFSRYYFHSETHAPLMKRDQVMIDLTH
jgi:hypothetical protein